MKPFGRVCGADLAERVRLAAGVAAQHAEDVDRQGRFPREAVDALRAGRLLGIMAPASLGGEDADLEAIAEICAELSGACAATGMIFAMHQINMANLLDCWGESEWHREFAGRSVREQLLFASATTEAGVGGDLRHSICAVETRDDAFALQKDASVISYGEQSDAIFVTARRDPDAPSSDQVLAIVCREQCEMEPLAAWDAMGMRGTCSGGWRIRCGAPLGQILPKPFADIAADSMVTTSHLLWGSVWFGIARDAFARAQAYVAAEAKRKPGQPPASSKRLAEVFAQLTMIDCCLRDSIRHFQELRADAGFSPTLSFSLAMNVLKVNVSSTALEVVDGCLLICGLEGYRNGNPFSLGRHLRDIHSARLMISNERVLAGAGQMLLIQRRH